MKNYTLPLCVALSESQKVLMDCHAREDDYTKRKAIGDCIFSNQELIKQIKELEQKP